MFQHILATLRAGMRSHAFRAISVLAVLLLGASYLASTFSGRHPQTVALDFGISMIRLVTLLLVLFWHQELLGREVDRRTVFFALSYPVPRAHYLLGRFFGVIALVILAIVMLGGALYLLVTISGEGYQQAFNVQFGGTYLLVLVGIALDAVVIGSVVLLLSSLATTAIVPLIMGAAFAIAARGYGAAYAFLLDKHGEAADMAPTFLPIFNVLAYILPDLGQLDWRNLVLYAQPTTAADIGLSTIYALSYAGIVLMMACFLFSRRDFQ